MAAAATTKVETLKKTLAPTQSSDPNPTPHPEDLHPITATATATNTSAAPPSSGGAVEKDSSDAGAGPVTDTQKKIRRAERFGMPIQLSEQEKRDSRAER